MRRALVIALCIIVLCSIAAVPLLLQSATPQDAQQQAIEKAINFFKDSREPYALLWLDVMYRRFGTSEFADALQRYDQKLAEHPADEALLRVFRRIADHGNVLQDSDMQSVVDDYDRLTVPALYCYRTELPLNYPTMLYTAANNGEYMLTHVLLALIWIQENGCEAPVSNSFIDAVYRANAALINHDSVVTDLELEAAAFLYLAGQSALVDDAFVEGTIAAQNNDGGWSLSSDLPGVSGWHPTILGLFILLHEEYPAESYPPMLAPASS
jgi:hypothetical protein